MFHALGSDASLDVYEIIFLRYVLVGIQLHPLAGASSENIVQKHLNMALLNVFYYFNGRYRHIFIP